MTEERKRPLMTRAWKNTALARSPIRILSGTCSPSGYMVRSSRRVSIISSSRIPLFLLRSTLDLP